jgi:hypothetical protein
VRRSQTSLIVRLYPQGFGTEGFQYEPRFQLRETSGKSGATIQNLLVGDTKGGGDNTGPGCWGPALRVATWRHTRHVLLRRGLEVVGLLRSLGRREDYCWDRARDCGVYR